MTAGATMLALVPMGIGRAGLDGLYYYPLARTVIGGLAASTILTLVILPFFYTLLDDLAIRARRLWRESTPVPVPAAPPAGLAAPESA